MLVNQEVLNSCSCINEGDPSHCDHWFRVEGVLHVRPHIDKFPKMYSVNQFLNELEMYIDNINPSFFPISQRELAIYLLEITMGMAK
jgi:hypothetical protein